MKEILEEALLDELCLSWYILIVRDVGYGVLILLNASMKEW